tara:strand:- start:2490 stop:2678 length:189 start_codon:yes stop_codon:yes gene_type:complete
VHVELEFQLLLRSALRVLLELGEHGDDALVGGGLWGSLCARAFFLWGGIFGGENAFKNIPKK